MGRAPCCEKMGLKKGPWTPEEDQVLINYIKIHGHGNWRALPKQAGLLRCGKSCRLRWTNYLRPDIKRGNFTREEEDTIINLHEMLGNRWSAIAAKLPGRTDNEIKNVWHTHLKKRLLKQNHSSSNDNKRQDIKKEQQPAMNIPNHVYRPVSPPESSCEVSTVTTSENNRSSSSNTVDNINMDMSMKMESSHEELSKIDENFWSEVLSADNSSMIGDLQVQQYLASSPLDYVSKLYEYDSDTNMDFWHNLFSRVGDLPQLPETL